MYTYMHTCACTCTCTCACTCTCTRVVSVHAFIGSLTLSLILSPALSLILSPALSLALSPTPSPFQTAFAACRFERKPRLALEALPSLARACAEAPGFLRGALAHVELIDAFGELAQPNPNPSHSP
jgi:hypothetical protein